jgi:glutathione S-transferase
MFFKATDKAIEEIKKCLAYLNDHLLTRTYFVGERISLADITVACNLLMLYKQVWLNRYSFSIMLSLLLIDSTV